MVVHRVQYFRLSVMTQRFSETIDTSSMAALWEGFEETALPLSLEQVVTVKLVLVPSDALGFWIWKPSLQAADAPLQCKRNHLRH
jgi:hypothetical protein